MSFSLWKSGRFRGRLLTVPEGVHHQQPPTCPILTNRSGRSPPLPYPARHTLPNTFSTGVQGIYRVFSEWTFSLWDAKGKNSLCKRIRGFLALLLFLVYWRTTPRVGEWITVATKASSGPAGYPLHVAGHQATSDVRSARRKWKNKINNSPDVGVYSNCPPFLSNISQLHFGHHVTSCRGF